MHSKTQTIACNKYCVKWDCYNVVSHSDSKVSVTGNSCQTLKAWTYKSRGMRRE